MHLITKPDNKWVREDKQKAEKFAKYLSSVFKPNPWVWKQ